jgi:hypothetical protein
MGQRSAEVVVGRLVTDEELHRRFVAELRASLRLAQQHGLKLTAAQIDALLASPVALWEKLAAVLGPGLLGASVRKRG